jgi:hypothetical protein
MNNSCVWNWRGYCHKEGMKCWILMAMALIGTGCSHAYIRESSNGQLTACCPAEKLFCSRGKLFDVAKEECGGPVRSIASETNTTGAAVERNLFNGQILGVHETHESCVTFKCGE